MRTPPRFSRRLPSSCAVWLNSSANFSESIPIPLSYAPARRVLRRETKHSTRGSPGRLLDCLVTVSQRDYHAVPVVPVTSQRLVEEQREPLMLREGNSGLAPAQPAAPAQTMVVQVDRIGKRFRIYDNPWGRLTEWMSGGRS